MSLLSRFLLAVIRVYQYVFSPLLGRSCRYHPTCSAYALESIRVYGGVRGGWMAAKRILRCHPYCAGGYDPVPQRKIDK